MRDCSEISLDTQTSVLNSLGISVLVRTMKSISQLPHVDLLEQLNRFIAINKGIDAREANFLSSCIEHCTDLRELRLDSNNMGDDGALSLASCIRQCTRLERLSIRSNCIGNTGARELAGKLLY